MEKNRQKRLKACQIIFPDCPWAETIFHISCVFHHVGLVAALHRVLASYDNSHIPIYQVA